MVRVEPPRDAEHEVLAVPQQVPIREAAEFWHGLHYRHHRGAFEDCDSRTCRQALEVLTREG